MSRFTVPAKNRIDPKNLSAVITAAGVCKKNRTKSLFSVGDKTLIEDQIDQLRSAFSGIDIVVVLGHEFDKIYPKIPRGIRIIETENYLDYTSCRSAIIGLRTVITDFVYIIHGDVLFSSADLRKSTPETHSFITNGPHNPDKVGLIDGGGIVNVLSYDLPVNWGQVTLLAKNDIEKFKVFYKNRKDYNPHIYEILNDMIESGTVIKTVQGNMKEINVMKDLE